MFPCHKPHRFHVAETTLGPKTLQATTKEYVVIAAVVCSTKSPIVAEMKAREFQEQNPKREMAPMNASGAHHGRQPQAKAAA